MNNWIWDFDGTLFDSYPRMTRSLIDALAEQGVRPSWEDAIAQIKSRHPKNIKFMCIIAAPEGLKALTEAHPDVQVYCASLDEHLNDHGYIVPGLGDAGDRIFGTK